MPDCRMPFFCFVYIPTGLKSFVRKDTKKFLELTWFSLNLWLIIIAIVEFRALFCHCHHQHNVFPNWNDPENCFSSVFWWLLGRAVLFIVLLSVLAVYLFDHNTYWASTRQASTHWWKLIRSQVVIETLWKTSINHSWYLQKISNYCQTLSHLLLPSLEPHVGSWSLNTLN